MNNNDHSSFKGWTILGSLVMAAVVGSCFWSSRQFHESPSVPTTAAPGLVLSPQEQRAALRERVARQVPQVLMRAYRPVALPNPVAARQAFHLQEKISWCVSEQMMAQANLRDWKRFAQWGDLRYASGSVQQDVVRFSLPFQRQCANIMIDTVLDDAPLAHKVAQAIKASGIEVDGSFQPLPMEWPQGLDQGSESRRLAELVGLSH